MLLEATTHKSTHSTVWLGNHFENQPLQSEAETFGYSVLDIIISCTKTLFSRFTNVLAVALEKDGNFLQFKVYLHDKKYSDELIEKLLEECEFPIKDIPSNYITDFDYVPASKKYLVT